MNEIAGFKIETKKKEIVIASIITLLLAILDLLGYPAAFIGEIKIYDVEPIYITLMINQWILILVGIIALKYLCPNLYLGFNFKKIKKDIKEFALPIIIIILVSIIAFYVGYMKYLDYKPSFWKVFIEGIVYYISVGILEELYIRGLLLNIIEKFFKKNRTIIAIVISSCIFGLGHIFGMFGLNIITILIRVIWTICLGIFFGVLYKKSNNLWITIITHFFINLCGIIICFSSFKTYPYITLIIMGISYIIMACWSIKIYKTKDSNEYELF